MYTIDTETATDNLLAVYQETTPEHKAQGTAWYPNAHAFCADLATRYQRQLPHVCAVVAILSPNCSWEMNKKSAMHLLATGQTFGNVYPANVQKAKRILSGELSLLEFSQSQSRYGQKVRAFYHNMLDPYHAERVTVDIHAIRGAYNAADISEQTAGWVFASKTGYQTLSTAYLHAAQHLELLPSAFQAMIWLTVKASLARNRKEAA